MNKSKIGFSAIEVIIIFALCSFLFADIFETGRFYLVGKNLTRSGAQYSDSIMIIAADTNNSRIKYIYHKIDPGFGQTFRYYSITSLYAQIIIQYRGVDTTGTAPNYRWWLEGRDTSQTAWSKLSDTTNLQATIDTTFKNDTLKGYIPLTNVVRLPASFRICLQSDSLNKSILREYNDSYLEPRFKTLE